MELAPYLNLFSASDAIAITLLFLAWAGIGALIEYPPASRPSVSVLMEDYRRDWMREFVTRQPRIFDANVIDSLRQGTSFFASACMIALGGGIALIGNSERLVGLAEDFTLQAEAVVVEIKVITVLLFVANAFLKFVWSHRLFGYCAVLMAAVPNDPGDPLANHRAAQAAEINITAAKGFNRGMRSVYFALGALAWLLGAVPLVAATALTTLVLARREFASTSRGVMLQRTAPEQTAPEQTAPKQTAAAKPAQP